MQIKNLTPGGYAANCFLLTADKAAVLIDPTCPLSVLQDALAETDTALAAILLTHGHFDHMLTAAEIKAKTGAPIYLGRGDCVDISVPDDSFWCYLSKKDAITKLSFATEEIFFYALENKGKGIKK